MRQSFACQHTKKTENAVTNQKLVFWMLQLLCRSRSPVPHSSTGVIVPNVSHGYGCTTRKPLMDARDWMHCTVGFP